MDIRELSLLVVLGTRERLLAFVVYSILVVADV